MIMKNLPNMQHGASYLQLKLRKGQHISAVNIITKVPALPAQPEQLLPHTYLINNIYIHLICSIFAMVNAVRWFDTCIRCMHFQLENTNLPYCAADWE